MPSRVCQSEPSPSNLRLERIETCYGDIAECDGPGPCSYCKTFFQEGVVHDDNVYVTMCYVCIVIIIGVFLIVALRVETV